MQVLNGDNYGERVTVRTENEGPERANKQLIWPSGSSSSSEWREKEGENTTRKRHPAMATHGGYRWERTLEVNLSLAGGSQGQSQSEAKQKNKE